MLNTAILRTLFQASFTLPVVLGGLAHPARAQAPVSGVYRLTTRAQPDLCLDVSGFGNVNGTPVILWQASKTSNQQWLVERQTDGAYKVYAYSGQNSLQMLDLNNGTVAAGTKVTTWEDNGNNAQRWFFREVGDGYYRLIPKNAGLGSAFTLQVRNGSNAAQGDSLEIAVYSGGDNQVFKLEWPGPSRILPNPKKGITGRWRKATAMNCSWFYHWGGDRPGDTPAGVEFVPMSWGYYGNADNASVNWLNRVKSQPGVKWIMGFNEPDNATQANLTVSYALEGWQHMANAGVPVLSPGCVHADSQWMKDFMAGAAARGYRVDAVAIHWYGGNDPNGFLGHVDAIHNLYGKPVWITEFCPADWSGSHGITPEQTANFMRVAVAGLNARPYVQRYSWYTGDNADGGGVLSNGGLVNGDGTLSDLGKLYGRM